MGWSGPHPIHYGQFYMLHILLCGHDLQVRLGVCKPLLDLRVQEITPAAVRPMLLHTQTERWFACQKLWHAKWGRRGLRGSGPHGTCMAAARHTTSTPGSQPHPRPSMHAHALTGGMPQLRVPCLVQAVGVLLHA